MTKTTKRLIRLYLAKARESYSYYGDTAGVLELNNDRREDFKYTHVARRFPKKFAEVEALWENGMTEEEELNIILPFHRQVEERMCQLERVALDVIHSVLAHHVG